MWSLEGMSGVAILLTTWWHYNGEESVCGLNFSLLVSYNYPSRNILCPVRLAVCALGKFQTFFFYFYFSSIAVQFFLDSFSPPTPLSATRNEIRDIHLILSSAACVSFKQCKIEGSVYKLYCRSWILCKEDNVTLILYISGAQTLHMLFYVRSTKIY